MTELHAIATFQYPKQTASDADLNVTFNLSFFDMDGSVISRSRVRFRSIQAQKTAVSI